MKQTLSILALLAAAPVLAQESRELGAHEHGVSTLNIAMDGGEVAMELRAPGADIVGFEYAAKTEEDRAAIDSALAQLKAPLDLFVVPADAGCKATEASAEIETEEGHEEHAHDDHAEKHHGDEGQAHDDHAAEHHGDEGHAHEEHHQMHTAGHTEFDADYALSCDTPGALTEITFAFFDTFPNAQEVEVQLVTSTGAQAFEVTRDAPVLNLQNLN
ncbi:zinc uptake protein ZrgA [Thalassococcus sp. BH17M4-6]|uniref:zinc uptake protein ZrgA n=1 Tax=Thalassococcus sp. BH17M4-6 TaxID=3413148 RepID=UPI003BEE8D9B